MPVQTEQLKSIDRLIVLTDGGAGSTTLTAAALTGATTLTVASITGFADNDPLRIGEGEEGEPNRVSGVPAGVTITLARALQKDHASGQAVVEQVADRYMAPEATSTVFTFSRETSDVFTTDQRLVHAVLKGFGSIRAASRLTGLTMYNLALALGVPRVNIEGTGASQTDPLALVNTGSLFGTLNNAALIFEGKRNDNADLAFEIWGTAFDYSGLSIPITRGQLAAVPLNLLGGGGGLIRTAASIWPSPTTTFLGNSGDVLDSIADMGFFTDTTPSTTLNGAILAGATTATATSGAGLVAGDIVRIDSGANVEYKRLKTVVTNALTFVSKIARDHATLVAIVKVLTTSFSSIDGAGATLNFGGNISEIRNAFFDMAQGLRYGGASMSVTVNLLPFTLANFARALGRPVPGGAFLPIFNNLGITNIDGMYIRGTLQNNKTFFAFLNAVQMDVSSVPIALSTTGDAPTTPLTGKPTVSLDLQVYT